MMSYNENAEAKQEFLKEEVKILHQRELDDLKWILSDPRGRRFIWRVLNAICHVFEGAFFGNSRDIYENAKQIVGKIILKDVMEATKFKALDKMLSEDEIDKQQAFERHKKWEELTNE